MLTHPIHQGWPVRECSKVVILFVACWAGLVYRICKVPQVPQAPQDSVVAILYVAAK